MSNDDLPLWAGEGPKCAWYGTMPARTETHRRSTEVARCDKAGTAHSDVAQAWFCAWHITSKQATRGY